MPTLVRFRFNKVTGEVEEFLVDDQDRNLSEGEHDRIAADIARFVAQNPRVLEISPARSGQLAQALEADSEMEGDATSVTRSETE